MSEPIDNRKLENRESDSTLLSMKNKLDPLEIAKIISQPYNLFIIQKLRDGPLKKSTMEKFVKAKFSSIKFNPSEVIDALEQKNIIKLFDVEKKEGDTVTQEVYMCLIRDFLAIRKPPLYIYDLLEQGVLPTEIKKTYQAKMKEYFKQYAQRRGIGDDLDVINIFSNDNAKELVEFLARNIITLKDPPKNLKMIAGNEEKYKNLLKLLQDKKIIYIANNPTDSTNGWIILLTEIEFQTIFPEYLINNITNQLKSEIIDKNIAILALNLIKSAYVEFEKPKYFQKLKQKLEQEKALFEQAVQNKDLKNAVRSINEISELYNNLGDYTNVKLWKQRLEDLKF